MADSYRPVSVLNRAMVMPAQPTHRHNLFLSCLDLYWAQDLHYNQRLIFYDNTSKEDEVRGLDRRAAAVMEQLKSSLALCLVHYYPWCGRIAEGAAPPHRLFIDCCDAGVEFVEASSHLPLSLLARDGFQMKPLFREFCPQPDHKGDCFFSCPLLSIQATLFSDGGLVLGIAHSHVVADGQSLWNFMVSWGECARGVPLSLPPLHSRELLTVHNPSPEKVTWSLKPQIKEDEESNVEADRKIYEDKDVYKCSMEDKESSVGTDAEGNQVSSWEPDGSAGTDASLDNKTDPLVQCMFALPASAIKKLKSEAGTGHTSYEVICAHFWKHVAAARGNATGAPTYFYAPVNCRTRMTPPLPASYFGNVIAFDIILSTTGAIRRESLCATACRVHDMVAGIKEGFVGGFMNWLEANNNRFLDVFESTFRGEGVNTGSSPWFPAYKVDYGWGKPVAVRPASVRGDGELVLFGGHPASMQGDVEICTALRESALRRLLNEPAFLANPPCSPLPNH